MCCPLLLLAFFGPRTALVFMWLTNYLNGVFDSALWPILGFLFLPFTTIAYAVAAHNGGMQGIWQIVVFIAVLVDLGVVGGSARHRQQRKVV